ncbi:MAG: PEP-utilizing enzyme [Candidatus Moraniibacteriota bacterium]
MASEKDSLSSRRTEHDFFHVNLPMYPITNFFHGGASSLLRYNDSYLCGPWYIRYRYEGNSEVIIPKESLIDYGMHFIRLLEEGDVEFTETLYRQYSSIAPLADRLQEINYAEVLYDRIPEKSEFYDEYAELFPWVIGVAYVMDVAFESYVSEHHIDLSDVKIPGESFIAREERELRQIARMDDGVEKDEKLRDHAALYSFILSDYKGYHPTGLAYFTDRLSGLMEGGTVDEPGEIGRPETMPEWIGFATHIRDERKRCNMLFNVLYCRYLKRECDIYGIRYEQAVMLSPDEFERQKKSGHLSEYPGERLIRTSHETGFTDITEEEWEKLSTSAFNDSLSGVTASKGRASGPVRVVMGRDDFDKVEEGDILVASMTRPEYAPILRKAAAIVTNEGSVTCHAAIVSRELGIPCIIGTQNATRILKDGDLVEVDADQGIVRKLSEREHATKEGTDKKFVVPMTGEYDLAPIYWNALIQTSPLVSELYGKTFPVEYNFFSEGKMNVVIPEKDWEEVGALVAERLFSENGFYEQIARSTEEAKKEVLSFLAEMEKRDLEVTSDRDLFGLAERVRDLFMRYDAASVFYRFVAKEPFVKRVSTALGIPAEDLDALSLPEQENHPTRMEREILEVSLDHDPNVNAAVRRLVRRYYWIPFGYDGPSVLDEEYFADRINENRVRRKTIPERLEAMNRHEHDTRQRSEYLAKQYLADRKAKQWITILRTMAIWTDERKMLEYQLCYEYGNVLKELSARFGIPIKNLKFLFTEELAGLKTNIEHLKRTSEERMNGECMTVARGGKVRIATDTEKELVKNVINRGGRK